MYIHIYLYIYTDIYFFVFILLFYLYTYIQELRAPRGGECCQFCMLFLMQGCWTACLDMLHRSEALTACPAEEAIAKLRYANSQDSLPSRGVEMTETLPSKTSESRTCGFLQHNFYTHWALTASVMFDDILPFAVVWMAEISGWYAHICLIAQGEMVSTFLYQSWSTSHRRS